MWPDETVVPLTNLPTAHPTEESEPATPIVSSIERLITGA